MKQVLLAVFLLSFSLTACNSQENPDSSVDRFESNIAECKTSNKQDLMGVISSIDPLRNRTDLHHKALNTIANSSIDWLVQYIGVEVDYKEVGKNQLQIYWQGSKMGGPVDFVSEADYKGEPIKMQIENLQFGYFRSQAGLEESPFDINVEEDYSFSSTIQNLKETKVTLIERSGPEKDDVIKSKALQVRLEGVLVPSLSNGLTIKACAAEVTGSYKDIKVKECRGFSGILCEIGQFFFGSKDEKVSSEIEKALVNIVNSDDGQKAINKLLGKEKLVEWGKLFVEDGIEKSTETLKNMSPQEAMRLGTDLIDCATQSAEQLFPQFDNRYLDLLKDASRAMGVRGTCGR